ncbi:MAG: outer membrane beta-barrel protein [Pseudomonadota bacterium]
MKKNILITISVFFVAWQTAIAAPALYSARQHPRIPFYVGGEVGWAYAHNRNRSLEPLMFTNRSFKRSNVTLGVYIGHEFTRYFGGELGFQYFRGAKLRAAGTNSAGTAFAKNRRIPVNTVQFLGRFKYPLYQQLYALLKVGGAYVHENALNSGNIRISKSKDDFQPIIIAGAEYRFTNSWAFDVLYTHLFGPSKRNRTASYDAVTGAITLYYE